MTRRAGWPVGTAGRIVVSSRAVTRRSLILLFDIDGTLITSGGAGRRAIERTFEQLFGVKDAFAGVVFAGMTDPAILRAGLERIGRPHSAADVERILALYLAVLEEEVARADRYRLHAGVAAALDRAEAEPDCALGLGTGNVEAGARVKLRRVAIADRFRFGGFGSDHEDRAELIRIGAERGAALLGRARPECRVVVIGDTPKDVAAARAIGADSIAVATSMYSVEALAAAGATWAFPDLDGPGALAALLAR